MKHSSAALIAAILALGCASRLGAVVFLETGNPQHHTSTPGNNSGWQYEGKISWMLGVPIAPYFFITAKHTGGTVGMSFIFHGDSYMTIAIHDNPATDLRIWEVDHSKPFPTYAPLSSGAADIGATATVHGTGTERGDEVIISGEPKGWLEGANGGGLQRWGRNVVVGTANLGAGLGEVLYCDFDNPGITDECHLTTGDSSGGLFVLENGLWRLAGINLAVDGQFRDGPSGVPFKAALYDMGGLQVEDGPGWTTIPNTPQNVPSRFYCSRISAMMPWISSIAPEVASLANENYATWQKLYFAPTEITTPATTGPLADYDGDGISNLLEFALNLDPTFSERALMDAGTGLRGLPLARLESISGSDKLTLEFVRRSAGSGAGLTYTPQFSNDLGTWQAVGSETVTTINPRWERVKIVDSQSTLDSPTRFVRLKVILAD